ncbi:MAG: hypothetical protein R2847_06960 [Bacteroidia bacterium]
MYWLFLQDKDFDSTLIQAKALDKSDNNGSRVYRSWRNMHQQQRLGNNTKMFSTTSLKKRKQPSMYIQAKMKLLKLPTCMW